MRNKKLPLRLILETDSDEPLYRQIYKGLRAAILAGRLAPGLRLPSSRQLSEEFDCARGTIVAAIEQLIGEGYLEPLGGSGTFVTKAIPDALLNAPSSVRPPKRPSAPPRVPKVVGAFALGQPALEAFPFPLWSKLLQAEWQNPRQVKGMLLHPFGHEGLRIAIAEYLAAARGFSCDPSEIVIMPNVRQSLVLFARMLLRTGEPIWMEEPGFMGIRAALSLSGMKPVPVPIDEQGFSITNGLKLAPKARLAVVSPANHFPLGQVMSLQRRLELLQWAENHDGWIVDNDYDGEYRYVGRPLTPLRALDRTGRVAYVGSFSKILFPALQLSYLVLPPSLTDPMMKLLSQNGSGTDASWLGQGALARFLNEDHFAVHLRRTRRLYAERQAALLKAAEKHLDGLLEVPAFDGGMHLVGKSTKRRFNDQAIATAAAPLGMHITPLSRQYAPESAAKQGLLLGYAAMSPAKINEAVMRLRGVLREAE